MSLNIHKNFENLKTGPITSEVLRNSLNDIIEGTTTPVDKGDIKHNAQQWKTQLNNSKIPLPDTTIANLAIFTTKLQSIGEEESTAMTGELFILVVEIFNYVSRSNMSPISITKKMDETLDSIQDKMIRLENAIEVLNDAGAISKKTSSKNRADKKKNEKSDQRGGAPKIVTIETMYDIEQGPKSPVEAPPSRPSTSSAPSESINPSSSNKTIDVDATPPTKKTKPVIKNLEATSSQMDVEPATTDDPYKGIDPKSEDAKDLRLQYAEYYSDDLYKMFSADQKEEMIKYYGDTVLMLSAGWKENIDIVHIVTDLTDKKTVLKMLEHAEKGAFSLEDARFAQIEFQVAVDTCGSLYGQMRCAQTDQEIPSIFFYEKK